MHEVAPATAYVPAAHTAHVAVAPEPVCAKPLGQVHAPETVHTPAGKTQVQAEAPAVDVPSVPQFWHELKDVAPTARL